jgi:transcriptional regulator with XRE-family HTH domain
MLFYLKSKHKYYVMNRRRDDGQVGNCPMIMYTKGMTLRQLLRQHGITRSSELAKRVGISRQQAYQLWQGKRALSRQMIYRVSEATGIAPADLFLAERPMPRPQPKGRPRTRCTEEEA